jgi:hypothetical protein
MSLRVDINFDKQMLDQLERFPREASKAAKLAINDTLDHGRTMAKRQIMSEVNLPASYLDGKSSEGRRLATRKVVRLGQEISGSIIGRRRPTSLYRYEARQLYAPAQKGGRKKQGVSVKVDRTTKRIPKAFIMNLKGGNHGVAIRLPKGQKPNRRWNGKPLYKNNTQNVYLLYGPSVNQVFDDVAEEIRPELNTYLGREFQRQLSRFING